MTEPERPPVRSAPPVRLAAPDRIETPTAGLGAAVYPLLNACVVPRPIAWVSTRSAGGVDNLAPHSYFTVASVVPPVVQFTSIGDKDSLRNCRETGEFVVCVATRPLAEQVNVTGTDYPPGTSEYAEAGLTTEPSVVVAPARVAESPVALECRVVGERSFGAATVVFGEVVHIAVSRRVADEDGRPDIDLLEPVARLGRDDWAALGEIFALRRVPYAAAHPAHPAAPTAASA